MTADELFVDTRRGAEVNGDFHGKNLVRPAVSQYSFNLTARQARFVIRHDGDLPRLKPGFLSAVLLVDLAVVRGAVVMTTARVCPRRCLATHK